MKEARAIARLKQGHIDGLEGLVRLHQEQAVRTAYLIIRDRTTAEDIVQSAFLRAYEHIDQFDSRRPFAPWFLQIVAHLAIRTASREGRTVPLETDDKGRDLLARLPAASPSPDVLVEQADTAKQLWALLEKLSPEQRAVIVLRYYAGLQSQDIADDLVLPPGTVRWRLHAALRRLRGLLQQSGWDTRRSVERQEKEAAS